MSRAAFDPALAAALDRFDAPRPSAGFAVRVAAHATGVALRRDRRGAWRRGRHALFGMAALGMLSAAAVASGLLGAAGIRVPVLTAMLDPQAAKPAAPVRVVKAHAKPPQAVRTATASAAAAPDPIAERQAFLEAHPVVAARVERRQAFLATHPRVAAAVREVKAERREFVAEHPELVQAARETLAARRQARLEGAALPPPAQVREAILERAQQIRVEKNGDAGPAADVPRIDPADRQALRELRQLREHRQALRELRRMRRR